MRCAHRKNPMKFFGKEIADCEHMYNFKDKFLKLRNIHFLGFKSQNVSQIT